jgi:hypothetical protein
LKHWRDVAAEQIIADLEASDTSPMPALIKRAFGGTLALERAVRIWAAVDPAAQNAVQAIDRRRLTYMEGLLKASGLAPATARARVQILYWAFIGFALSDKPLPRARQDAVLEELIRMASR